MPESIRALRVGRAGCFRGSIRNDTSLRALFGWFAMAVSY